MDVMLAKTYSDQDPSGWLMSEKLDGVRALWNGEQLLTRNGNVIHAPAWFTDALPTIPLDGELWAGRGQFQRTVSAVRKNSPVDSEWEAITYMVFDAPAAMGGFEARLEDARLQLILAPSNVAQVLPQIVCAGRSNLDAFYDHLTNQGAEGVMLRRAGSAYESKRSASLLKHKPTLTDEAEVIGHEPGKGRHIGRVGALLCRWKGVVFYVGTGLSDELREAPPAVGALITFSFQCLTDGGVPRFPVLIAERNYE